VTADTVVAGPAYVHGVLARLVEHPDRPAVEASGAPAAPGRPDPCELDAERVRQVTGFITKVRHNPVRFRLPLTMRALAAAGVEIEFFAHHAPAFTAWRRGGMTDEERTARFVAALRDWLDPALEDHRLVADVLAHELTLAEVAGLAPVAAPAVDSLVHRGSRPRLRTGVRLLHLTVHPPDVASGSAGTASLEPLDRAPRCYAYIPTTAGPRVKNLDPALAPLVECADGSTTVAEMAAALGLEAAAERMAACFELLVHRGLADVED
jgi:hypothetical protein